MIIFLLFVLAAVQGVECAEWSDCRARALAAAATGDVEAFHDLAWRAVQKGPPRDPDLMYLLARAQSLSGRPGDALVMLRRLAEMGIATDAVSNDEFARVRALPAWRDLEPLISRPPAASSAASAPLGGPPPANDARAAAPAATTRLPPPIEAIAFETPRFTAAGLGYDAVSRRFVVADRDGRKLFVVDEGSQRANDLVGAASAGFHTIAALDIDAARGDLWVVSGEPATGAAALHRLQLVSGRSLETIRVPESLLPVRFADVAVAAGGAVLALDAAGGRIFRVRPESRALEVAATLELTDPISIAPAAAGVVYVAHADGLARVDLSASSAAPVTSALESLSLSGLERIRWRRGALVGVQRADGAGRRIVRIALGGRRGEASALEILDPSVPASAAWGAALAGDAFYYLTIADSGAAAVKRISLR